MKLAEKVLKINEASDKDVQKAADIMDGLKDLFSAGKPLEDAFGKKNVSSLGMFPGFKIKAGGKSIAVLAASNVDKPDATAQGGKIAIGVI